MVNSWRIYTKYLCMVPKRSNPIQITWKKLANCMLYL